MAQQREPSPAGQATGAGSGLVQCPMHGIAYDAEKEVCPECAKTQPKAPSVAVADPEKVAESTEAAA